MKFSVLMSVYNKEKANNLIDSLNSLINQTLMPTEIILVKDGPLTDELDSVISSFSKKYKILRVISLKKNVGLGEALNEGLKYCKYEYVARMDSDDICMPDRFEKQILFFKQHEDCDVLGGYILEFDDQTGHNISKRLVPLDCESIKLFLKKRNPMNHMSVMFKKNSVFNAGSYMHCPYFEDYYLWARMLKQGYHFANLKEVLIKARAGLGMSGRRGSIKYAKCIINFETKLLKLGLIGVGQYFINIFIRVSISIMPNKIRYILYQRRLRNESN